MLFNVNGHVKVKLTDAGREIHRDNYAQLLGELITAYPYSPPEEDGDGWSEWQMWHLMQQFGPHMGCGVPVPFETEITIDIQQG